MDAMVAACRRFGAEKAESVVSACEYSLRGKELENETIFYVRSETGIEINHRDILFVRKLLEAKDAVDYAVKALKDAVNIPSQR